MVVWRADVHPKHRGKKHKKVREVSHVKNREDIQYGEWWTFRINKKNNRKEAQIQQKKTFMHPRKIWIHVAKILTVYQNLKRKEYLDLFFKNPLILSIWRKILCLSKKKNS